MSMVAAMVAVMVSSSIVGGFSRMMKIVCPMMVSVGVFHVSGIVGVLVRMSVYMLLSAGVVLPLVMRFWGVMC